MNILLQYFYLILKFNIKLSCFEDTTVSVFHLYKEKIFNEFIK